MATSMAQMTETIPAVKAKALAADLGSSFTHFHPLPFVILYTDMISCIALDSLPDFICSITWVDK